MTKSNLTVFISYRRDDNADFVERIRDWFMMRYGRDNVFMDFDTLPPFVPFAEFIRERVRESDVVVAIIGPRWLELLREKEAAGLEDYVRIEVGLALKEGKLVAPICIKDAPIPREADLPPDVRPMLAYNAARIDTGRHFLDNIDRIVNGLEQAITWHSQARSTQPHLARINDLMLSPHQRAAAAHELAKMGDPRPGVGLTPSGLPDIDWVEIPGGEFIFQENDRITLPAFYIARYPITVQQFQAFIDDPTGYGNDAWWDGLAHREPRPYRAQWPTANHPRDHVSWYQAIAFGRWLTDRLGYRSSITLPTEKQWEKAARGTDGRTYPWGNVYISGYANIDETFKDPSVGITPVGEYFIGQTTPVGIYPQGASPYGVLDMSGNVWEWCLTEYENWTDDDLTNTNQRVGRGGSWDYSLANSRTTMRGGDSPASYGHYLGFRVCVEAPE